MNDLFKPDDTRDALRKIGGLLLGLGAAMIYIRKGPFLTVNPKPVGQRSRCSWCSPSRRSTCTARS